MAQSHALKGLEETPRFGEALEASGIFVPPPSGHLYHYTSATGLLAILESKALIASDVAYFNDTSEYDYGLSLLAPLLPRFDDASLKGVAGVVDELVAAARHQHNFAACFCAQDDLLGQWHGYGANGSGYSLGFRYEDLSRDGTAILAKVQYGEEEVSSSLARVVDWSISALRRIIETQPRDKKQQIEAVLTATVGSLYLVVAASKRAVFRHEQEWRLLVPGHALDGGYAGKLGFRAAEGLVVPYVLAGLPELQGKLLLASVCCGPMRHESRKVDGVRALLDSMGLAEVPINVSEAPLRR